MVAAAAPRAPRPQRAPRERRPDEGQPRPDDREPRRDDGERGPRPQREPAMRDGGGRGPRPGGSSSGGPRGRGGMGERREGPPHGRPVADDELTRVPGAPTEPPPAPPAEAEDEVDFAGRTLRDVLNLLGLTDTEIAAREPETAGDGAGLVAQVLEVYGNSEDASNELGLLIGRRGETLSSLQYLLNVMVSTRYGGDTVFGLDVEQYRKRREETLVEMARRIAAEVRETGDVITLEPMPPAERRIIHITLESEAGVRTESVGHGNDRQVEVLPAESSPE
jgi:spoIIIJ-associated protein